MMAVLVLSPGPPLVTRYDCPNMLALAKTVVVMVKTMTFRSPGIVTWTNFPHDPAPSMEAASYWSAWDLLQPGQVDDAVETERPPDGHADERDPGPRMSLGPADRRDTEKAEKPVDQAELSIEKVIEQEHR